MSDDPTRREPPHTRARYYRLRRRPRRMLTVVGWCLWGLTGLVVAAGFGGYVFLEETLEAASPDTEENRAARRATTPKLPGEPVNVLLIGSDVRPGEESASDPGRSDSLILVRMDKRRGFISMMSFLRDLVVDIPGVGRDRINAAYQEGGVEKTIDTVEALTGEPVNEYVLVDFDGFSNLVDTVGGVYLDVDRRYFNDNAGCIPGATCYDEIDLQPGYQRLDGVDALDYVRYRHGDSDYSRTARQQQFLSEVKRQTSRLGNLTKITSFRSIIGDNLRTGITDPRDFLGLLELALTTPDNKVARIQLGGTDATTAAGAAVLETDPATVAAAVAQWKEPEFLQEAAVKPPPPESVQVTVLNGSGRLLAAEGLAEALRAKGYDAQPGGNAEDFAYASSAVFYSAAFRPSATVIRPLLGTAATVAPLAAGQANGNEVVVVAGADWTGALQAPPPPEKRPPPSTVDTTSLVDPLRAAQRAAGFPMLVPLKVASGSEVRIVRTYRIAAAGGGAPAAKIVFRTPTGRYWGMSMTTMRNPPIVGGRTGVTSTGGREYFTYYDGRNLQRLAWQRDGVTYWISNTLDYELSAKTIEEIAKSTRTLGRAKLPKGRSDTAVPVETTGTTP